TPTSSTWRGWRSISWVPESSPISEAARSSSASASVQTLTDPRSAGSADLTMPTSLNILRLTKEAISERKGSWFMSKAQVEPRIRDLGLAERIPERLAETDYDAIIGISVESAQYLSGYWFPYARNRLNRQNIVIWPKEGEPVLLVGVDQLPGP